MNLVVTCSGACQMILETIDGLLATAAGKFFCEIRHCSTRVNVPRIRIVRKVATLARLFSQHIQVVAQRYDPRKRDGGDTQQAPHGNEPAPQSK